MLRLITVIVLVIVFALGATLGFSNGDNVTFHYLFGSVELRIAVLVLIAFAVGALLALLLGGLRMLGLHREIRRLRRQLRDAETELKNLRNLPLAAAPSVTRPLPAAALPSSSAIR
jgi:uncharacterized membrane protein YciS (DUF1049 family)